MTGNVSNPKNNGVAGIIGEGYGNANHVTFYGTRYNDHSEHDIWVGEQNGTLTNQHADDLNNDATLTSYLGSFSGNDLYRQAIQYSYAVNIKNIGTGIMTSNLERTRPGQTVRLTKASGNSVASVTVKDADSNPITVSGNEMNGWTFTMPQRDVTVTAAFLNDDGTVPDTGMSIDVWNGSSQARPGYFDASSHTIHIQSAAQLIYVYNNWDNEVFSGYDYYECNYILDTDLDMSTKTWKPLGSKAYKGTFNGNGHMIRIKIDDSSISHNGQGLFATIASGSRVENLHVDGKIKVGNARLVGGIAGDNYGTVPMRYSIDGRTMERFFFNTYIDAIEKALLYTERSGLQSYRFDNETYRATNERSMTYWDNSYNEGINPDNDSVNYANLDKPYVRCDVTMRRGFNPNKNYKPTKGIRYTVIQGYTRPAEFYSPLYPGEIPVEAYDDARRTLYWNPRMTTDENGEIKIGCYNNRESTFLNVNAETIVDGQPVSTTYISFGGK